MKKFGEGDLMLPIFAGATLVGPLLRPLPSGELVGESGSRCLRSVAVSGHAFIGAIAFVNAAKMTDRVGLKLALYTFSVLPAWSRINDQRHYLSQAALGWWMAYLAASAVDETERFKRDFAVMPLATGDGLGMSIAYRW